MGETQENKSKDKWYFSISFMIVAFLVVGPFALPLLWLNPTIKPKTKVIVTVIVLAFTVLSALLLATSIKNIYTYYNQIQQM